MSKENLEQFMNQIGESDELQTKFRASGTMSKREFLQLGAECGCGFTAVELDEFVTPLGRGCADRVAQFALETKWLRVTLRIYRTLDMVKIHICQFPSHPDHLSGNCHKDSSYRFNC